MKRRVFKNDALQKHFEENGYCIVPLISANEIEQLQKVYHDNRVNDQPAIEITIKNPGYELNKKIKDLSSAILLPRINTTLENYRMLHAGFIAKIPGKPNIIKLHQDSTFVDETNYTALNVWCPLIDLDESNGALWIIEHSDRFFPGLRGQPFKEFDFNDIGDEVISKYGTMLKVKAGEAIIYDTALLHYSKQNVTDKIRIVCNVVMVPAEVQALYYHFDKVKNELEKFEIDDDFLLSYFSRFLQTGKIEARLLETISGKTSQKVSVAQFEEQYFRHNHTRPSGLLQRFARLFIRN